MSGNAALSAARKRRASSSPSVAGSTPSSQQFSGSYYTGNNIQHIQTMMNQSNAAPPRGHSAASSAGGANVPPTIPLNVYENIEMIKQQIEQRTKLIQTQGSTMTPEKLKILHKQNEVQIQILKQRMLMVQEMEMAASPKTTNSPVQMAPAPASAASAPPRQFKNEPQFIYEKGIPRPNPNYNNGNMGNIDTTTTTTTSTTAHTPQQRTTTAQPSRTFPTAILTPFVSMITSTGATPPPLVILKSHDEKIGEHDAVLNDLANRINYIHSQVDELSQSNSSNARGHAAHAHVRDDTATDVDADAHEDEDADADEPGDETELLMETVMNDLINSRDFVQGIVDKIVNETNLSETILKVEPIIKENQELRSLIHSQQQMLNEMNTMVMRLLNQRQQYNETDATDASDADATAATAEAEDTNPATEVQNDENGFDENGLCHQQSSSVPDIMPLHGFIVPNMDNADMSICYVNDNVIHEDPLSVLIRDTDMDAAIDAAVDAAIDDEPEAEHDDDHDYTAEAPHFPSDSRIALVINEI